MELQAALLAHHGPFVWGRDLKKAYENSIVLEECAKIAFATLQINSNLNTLPQYYLDEHYLRKNGKKSRYGQIYDSSSGLEPN
jgi:L-ribulose-5-phosphate 4-epimerase